MADARQRHAYRHPLAPYDLPLVCWHVQQLLVLERCVQPGLEEGCSIARPGSFEKSQRLIHIPKLSWYLFRSPCCVVFDDVVYYQEGKVIA